MFSSLFGRSRWPIGLELGVRHVRMLQLAGVRPGWQVQALAERTLGAAWPEAGEGETASAGDLTAYHEAVAEAVGSMVREGAFRGRRLVVSPPPAVLQVKNLRLPPMPDRELAEAVMWEATDRLKIDREANEIRFFNAGEVRQGAEMRQEVILMAMPRAFVEAHVQAMAGLGLEVACVDAPMAALARAVYDRLPEPPQPPTPADVPELELELDDATTPDARLIVKVNDSATQVVITQHRQIVFYKVINDFGLAAVRQAWADAGVAGDEVDINEPGAAAVEAIKPAVADLVRELSLCLRYYSVTFRGERPAVAILTGEGATAWLAEQLGEQGAIAAERATWLDDVENSAAWCTALGLSLGQAGEAGQARRAEGRAA